MSLFKNIFSSGPSEDLRKIIEQGAFLVDVRDPGEFALGSVKGAVNIPLGNVAVQLARFKGKENIVVFCRSGNRSSMAKQILDSNGIKNVVNGGTWLDVSKLVRK